MQNIRLLEAKQHMTPREKQLHKKLIKLLLDDGRGHHHKKYAVRLKDFNIKIVSLQADPTMTAAISFDLGIIYISEGFLLDESLFYQLNVLIRHELAHNLLMHQIRMMAYLGPKYSISWGVSPSLFTLTNILEDMEISDKIYNDEDMETVRNMYLNGQLIGGIITEDIRSDWIDMPVEVMHAKLCEEIDAIHKQIADGIKSAMAKHQDPKDFLTRKITSTIEIYGDTESMSILEEPIEDIAANGFKVNGQEIRKDYKEILEAIYKAGQNNPYTAKDIEDILKDIKRSSPIRSFDLTQPSTGAKIVSLHTPEQKQFALEVFKKYRSAEVEWYNAVMSVMKRNNYDMQTVQDIWNRTRGVQNGD